MCTLSRTVRSLCPQTFRAKHGLATSVSGIYFCLESVIIDACCKIGRSVPRQNLTEYVKFETRPVMDPERAQLLTFDLSRFYILRRKYKFHGCSIIEAIVLCK